MSKDQKQQLIDALVDFVIRATSKNATPEEIAALPEVANILLSNESVSAS